METFLSIERVFEAAGTTDLYARCSLIGVPADVASALGRYGSFQDSRSAVVLPIPSHQSKLAAAGVLRHLRVSIERGIINRAEFVDRADGRGSTAKENEGVSFTKARDDTNSTRPAHRSEVNLNATLIGKSAEIRHAEPVIARRGDDRLNAALQKYVDAWKGGSTSDTDTSLEKIHSDIERLKREVAAKALTALAKVDSRFKGITVADVLDQSLDQASGTEIAGGPATNLVDDLGLGRKLNPPITVNFQSMDAQQAIELAGRLAKLADTGLTAEQIEMARNSGKSLFALAYVADRTAGISRRSFTYNRG